MKTIKDAVIELKGKLPNEHKNMMYPVLAMVVKTYVVAETDDLPVMRHESDCSVNNKGCPELLGPCDCRKPPIVYAICSPEEFESCAKRLGYINGYRYGVEYPTNGKRPELADDVFVQVTLFCGEKTGCCAPVHFVRWENILSFKITDQRYKPADTSYLNQCKYRGVADVDQLKVKCMHLIDDKPVDEASGPLHVSLPCGAVTTDSTIEFVTESPSTDFPFERVNSNWHERGELPPVGCDSFEWSLNGKCWEHGLMLFNDGVTCLIANKKYPANRHHLKSIDPDLIFRPIRTEREKVIEAANKIYYASVDVDDFIENLVKAGMLVLPPKKSDTED